jgi:hypothetical protein
VLVFVKKLGGCRDGGEPPSHSADLSDCGAAGAEKIRTGGGYISAVAGLSV